MINAWIVVREERHVEDKYWVCLVQEDAIAIATDVTKYWLKECEPEHVDTTCYGNRIFSCSVEDAFSVYVMPQDIRDRGETDAQTT